MEKRVIMDQILRDCILELASESKEELKTLEEFVTFTIQLSRRDICSPSIPVVLLSDIFDVFTLDQCEKLFIFVENEVAVWKEDLFFGACKNNLLRMCNDLLRRLSRSQNTVFRGRILLFLAKFFPFSERSGEILTCIIFEIWVSDLDNYLKPKFKILHFFSGLNIVSEFNLDNVAEYSQDVSQIDNFEASEEQKDESKFKIDYNFYNKFLTLQDFMRSPNQCYNKVTWRIFVNVRLNFLKKFSTIPMRIFHYAS